MEYNTILFSESCMDMKYEIIIVLAISYHITYIALPVLWQCPKMLTNTTERRNNRKLPHFPRYLIMIFVNNDTYVNRLFRHP